MLESFGATGGSSDPSGGHQADPVRRRRLRWRARRGLLENDLVLTRFFDRYETDLSDELVAGLDALLDQPDNDLLDFILARRELPEGISTPATRKALALLQRV